MKFFGKRPAAKNSPLRSLEQTLSDFAAVALSSVSAQQLDDSKMRALAMAYVYGAVTYLSEYDGILDESGRELAAGLLARHFVLDAKASRIVGEELSHAPQRDQRRFFMIE